MPLVKLDSDIFDSFEKMLNLPQVTMDYQSGLDTMMMGDTASRLNVLQVSSALIRVEQKLWEFNGTDWVKSSFEFRLAGSGIGPVSNLDALMTAINDGLATGSISKVAIRQDGVEILGLSLSTAGYVLSSGDQSLTLNGKLPLKFSQFFDLGGLFNQAMNIDTLTRAERLALFADLSNYGVTGLTIADGAKTLFAAKVTATTASLTLNGMTFALTGTFPDNFGEDLSLLWETARAMRTGNLSSLAIFTSADLTITELKITDASGAVLLRVANPLADTPMSWMVDGVSRDHVLMGDMGGNSLSDEAGSFTSVIAGMGGDDILSGNLGTDQLYGGTGGDTLLGGKGNDLLDGGAGRDELTGGLGIDRFVFNLGDGSDVIHDFVEGVDKISIVAANVLGDLTFTRVGTDVQIDYKTIHILVEDTTIAELRVAANFLF